MTAKEYIIYEKATRTKASYSFNAIIISFECTTFVVI